LCYLDGCTAKADGYYTYKEDKKDDTCVEKCPDSTFADKL
jgi:hypothetical protein